MSNPSPIAVAVFANRLDFWFTKLCVASIRFYYPTVDIYLIKDKLNGDFDTGILSRRFNIHLLDLGTNYYGWSAAKIHFAAHGRLPAGRYLTMDSDIIFAGKVLDKLQANPAEFIAQAEHYVEPFPPSIVRDYFDPAVVKKKYGDYEYPGFFFNAGQLVVTSGVLSEDDFDGFFDFDNYPYYKDRIVFPTVDQSILNYVLPKVAKKRAVRLSGGDFMLWSVNFFENPAADSVETIESGDGLPYLIHYAGDTRTYKIEEMKGSRMLGFFREYYYSRLTASERKRSDRQDRWFARKQYSKLIYKKNRLLMKLFNLK